MSLKIEKNKARFTVYGRGWNDTVNDSGPGGSEEGLALEDFSADLGYDFGDDFDWDSLAQDLDINLDLDGNIDLSQQESLSEDLASLADNEEMIYNYMMDHDPSTGVPARICVINPPDKTEYEDGEMIDYTGIVVAAYASLTTRTPFIQPGWDGPRHNQIPYDELTFPVTRASSSTIGTKITCDTMTLGPFTNILEIGRRKADVYAKWLGKELYWETEIGEDAVGIFFSRENSSFGCICASLTNHAVAFTKYRTEDGGERVVSDTYYTDTKYTCYGKTVYTSYVMTSISDAYKKEGDFLDVPTDIGRNLTTRSRREISNRVSWALLYGDKTAPIPVQWQTEYREEPYEDSFDIMVIQ